MLQNNTKLFSPIDRSYKYSQIWMPLFYVGTSILIAFLISTFVYTGFVFNYQNFSKGTIFGFALTLSLLIALFLCLLWIAICFTNSPISSSNNYKLNEKFAKELKWQNVLAVILKVSMFIIVIASIMILLLSGYTSDKDLVKATQKLVASFTTIITVLSATTVVSWFYYIKLKFKILNAFESKNY